MFYYIDSFLAYMQSGGFVMWPLLFLSTILWYALGYRYHSVVRGSNISVRELVRRHRNGRRKDKVGILDLVIHESIEISTTCLNSSNIRRLLDDAHHKYIVNLRTFEKLITAIVVVAPLIGLLGTVIGMIETFDSLASASLFSQTGGIAGGISQALFTTQFGLVVAVPGLVIGRIIDRHANKIIYELEQVKDLICSEGL